MLRLLPQTLLLIQMVAVLAQTLLLLVNQLLLVLRRQALLPLRLSLLPSPLVFLAPLILLRLRVARHAQPDERHRADASRHDDSIQDTHSHWIPP